MKQFIRIGVDLAKNYFQVHALESENGPALTRKLKRSKMHEFFSQIEPGLIGMEACGSAHHWARELKALGHEVLLMPLAYTKPMSSEARTMRSMRMQSVRLCRGLVCALCRSRARSSKRR